MSTSVGRRFRGGAGQGVRLVGDVAATGDRGLAVHHVDEAENINLGAEAGLGLKDDWLYIRPPWRRHFKPRELAEHDPVGIDYHQAYRTNHDRASGP